MNPLVAAVVVVVVVAVAAIAGLLWRRRDGRVRTIEPDRVSPLELGYDTAAFGDRATLVQFSTEMCARCPSVRRLLTGFAAAEGVGHVEVDLTHRPDLASRFHVLQTPTTLLLDGSGILRARIGGMPRRDDLEAEIARVTEGADA
ncbi:TlpA family protein disulfide reductase [Microbacterium halotolerans]|uniref:TlpA family protein disulfide reductase n=1 Tax=Microbacterium halotolerans TaxID=246613 RepID=UPI000E6AE1F1|nr:thioredoxin family protein [Microbacterium halotolerans]